jgi:hypothetical protein
MVLADTAFRRRKANALFLGLGGLAKPISPPVIIIPAPVPIPLDKHFQWWSYVKGSNWRIVKASGSRSLTPQPRMTASLQNPDALAKKTSANLDDCPVCSSSWRRESNAVRPLSMILKFYHVALAVSVLVAVQGKFPAPCALVPVPPARIGIGIDSFEAGPDLIWNVSFTPILFFSFFHLFNNS